MENTNTTEHENDESPLETSAQEGLGLDPASWAIAATLGKWVGEKIAGGIVSAAAGKVFNEAMKAIGLGEPDLVEKLDKLSAQVAEVQKSLDRLTEMTAEILKQLAELKDFFEKTLKLETLLAAMTRIDVAYTGSAATDVLLSEPTSARAISLRQLVEVLPHTKDVTPKQLQDAAQAFAEYVSDIPDQIATIQVALAKVAFGQNSLLTHWAKELSRQVNTRQVDRETAYVILESYFLQAISVQLKGVSIHCTALATDPHGDELVPDFLVKNFAPTMKAETAAFVQAAELLMVLTLKASMQTGLTDGKGGREFPKHVDELLIRADLICAALNLVAYKGDASGKPSPTIQAAVQGIYGRAFLRPSDLTDGKAPDLAIAGYSATAAKDVRQLSFPCLDLYMQDGVSVLRDVSTSNVTVAHYYWPFSSPVPAEGKELDPNQRGGVTVKRYPVFGTDEPGVLAASVFDVSRLYRGLPSGTAHSYKFDKFPGGNNDLGYRDEKCTGYHHPLCSDSGDAFETAFTELHIYRLAIMQHSNTVHALFKYDGSAIRARITAFVASILHRDARIDGQGGTAFGQKWEVTNRLRLRQPNGSKDEFYNSVLGFGVNRPLSIMGARAQGEWRVPYDARQDGTFSMDFDLVPGTYELILESETAVWESPKRYEGWQSSTLKFFLHGLSIERL